MKQKLLVGLMLIVAVALSACTTSGNSNPHGYDDIQIASIDSFAQCLTDKGVTMYGASWCSHCANQKALFGESFEKVNYVECTVEGEKCDAAGITGYPTWIANGQSYPGEQSFQALASISGCVAPQI